LLTRGHNFREWIPLGHQYNVKVLTIWKFVGVLIKGGLQDNPFRAINVNRSDKNAMPRHVSIATPFLIAQSSNLLRANLKEYFGKSCFISN
jgi:hypothetical protein